MIHTIEQERTIRDLKWAKTMQVFADWSPDDIKNFSQLFLRFNQGMRRAYPSRS